MSTRDAWGDLPNKYTVHEETLEYFRAGEDSTTGNLYCMTPEVARRIHEQNAIKYAGTTDFEGKVKEFIVPSPDASGKITFIEAIIK